MSSEIVGPAHQALKDPAGQGAHKDNVHPARMRVTDHAGGGPAAHCCANRSGAGTSGCK
jgi:hypothetical protein